MAAGLPKMNKTECEAPKSWLLNCLPPEERSQLHALMQHRAIFSSWSNLANIRQALYTLSVNKLIDRGESELQSSLEMSNDVAKSREGWVQSNQSKTGFESIGKYQPKECNTQILNARRSF